MSIKTAVCMSYDVECWQGIHQPGDDYRLVLLRPGAQGDHGPRTARYADVQADELPGALGYPRGGLPLGGFSADMADGTPGAGWAEAVFPAASFSAAGAVIVNASKEGRAVAVLDFGGIYTGNGSPFRVPLARVIQRPAEASA